MYNVAILGMDWFFNMTLATMDVQRSYAGIHKGYMDCFLGFNLLRVDVCVPCTHTHTLSPSGEELVCCVEWTNETAA